MEMALGLTVHDNLEALLQVVGDEPILLTSGLGGVAHWSAQVCANMWIFFGKESAGLPSDVLALHSDRIIQIPMRAETRGLNLATSAGIVLYEALRQIQRD